jgi:hypothetical protein
VSDSDPLLERLSRAADAAAGDDERAATFARGLILGALVGAAIAGSTIWQRRHARPKGAPADGGAAADEAKATRAPLQGG